MSPDNPINKSANAVGPEEASPEENPHKETLVKPIPKVKPTPQHQKERTTCKPDSTPLWKIVLECGAVAVGIIVAIIYYKQLQTMNDTLDLSRKTSERESRALVSIKPVGDIQVVVDQVPEVKLVLNNLGKTTARQIVGEIYIEVIPKDQGPTFVHGNPTPSTRYTAPDLFPTETHDLAAKRLKAVGEIVEGGPAGEWPISKDEYASLLNGDTYLAAHGYIDYVDVYHVAHWSRFCVWRILKPGQFKAKSCTQYNTTDENDEP